MIQLDRRSYTILGGAAREISQTFALPDPGLFFLVGLHLFFQAITVVCGKSFHVFALRGEHEVSGFPRKLFSTAMF
jgi:hypothetical protein